LSALCACATSSASNGELLELRAEVRALREENARLDARLEHLEQNKTPSLAAKPSAPSPLVASRTAPSTAVAPATDSKAGVVPALTVVKLKPKREAAPKLNTEVEVLEPSPDSSRRPRSRRR
jgi:hypothetical protein